VLPGYGVFRFFIDVLQETNRIDQIVDRICNVWCTLPGRSMAEFPRTIRVLEAMVNDGWVDCTYDKSLPLLDLLEVICQESLHKNRDTQDASMREQTSA